MSIDTSAAAITTPIQFIQGALSAQVPGTLSAPGQKVYFSAAAEAGQKMIVNLIPTTTGLATGGVVVFPDGQQTGQPGGVIMNQVLEQSGTYTIQAFVNNMASQVNAGDFLAEVIILPSYLND